jgi:NitT/TauT family transport system substrate-binding protein
MRRPLAAEFAAALIAALALLAGLGPAGSVAAADKRPLLVLAGPPASVSTPLIHMVESGALNEIADKVEFRVWKDPDQLRVIALGGQADFVAMPTNVAANLYNRGVDLRLLNVSTWGMLWMVSRDGAARTLADFRGKEIAMPFRADMPDIVFGLVAGAQGLDPKKDFKLRYVASPLDAMQLLITRRVDHALLAEPAISMALRKTKSFPVSLVAPDLYRSVDLQQEWGRLYKREARIPQAGIAALGKAVGDRPLQEAILAAYARSLEWCRKNALQCGEMVAKRIDLLSPEAVADSLAVSRMQPVAIAAARSELEFFFARLHEANPALIGGKLPDERFYAP